jgi:hypothetical protein
VAAPPGAAAANSANTTAQSPYYEVPFAVHIYPADSEAAVAAVAVRLRAPALGAALRSRLLHDTDAQFAAAGLATAEVPLSSVSVQNAADRSVHAFKDAAAAKEIGAPLDAVNDASSDSSGVDGTTTAGTTSGGSAAVTVVMLLLLAAFVTSAVMCFRKRRSSGTNSSGSSGSANGTSNRRRNYQVVGDFETTNRGADASEFEMGLADLPDEVELAQIGNGSKRNQRATMLL